MRVLHITSVQIFLLKNQITNGSTTRFSKLPKPYLAWQVRIMMLAVSVFHSK